MDETQHKVKIREGFWMGKYEVTQEQWERVMDGNPSMVKGERLPVDRVSWDDCQDFLKKLNAKVGAASPGGAFRLPSEAEWEYACRAGTKTAFYTGNSESDVDKAAWYTGNSEGKVHEVGQKLSNAWGLFDMHGNACEWCQYGIYDYVTEVAPDPTRPGSASGLVYRGGAWNTSVSDCRSARRCSGGPTRRREGLGFRLLRAVGP